MKWISVFSRHVSDILIEYEIKIRPALLRYLLVNYVFANEDDDLDKKDALLAVIISSSVPEEYERIQRQYPATLRKPVLQDHQKANPTRNEENWSSAQRNRQLPREPFRIPQISSDIQTPVARKIRILKLITVLKHVEMKLLKFVNESISPLTASIKKSMRNAIIGVQTLFATSTKNTSVSNLELRKVESSLISMSKLMRSKLIPLGQ